LNTPAEIEETILGYLEHAIEMRLELSEDDSDYDLHFITKKVAQVSAYTERLSDMMLQLTKIGIQCTRCAGDMAASMRLKTESLKASEEYGDTPRSARAEWLSNQLEGPREEAERWKQIAAAVSSIKEAVAERASTMKRLDSDLRLQSKLLEAKIAAGATSSNSFLGAGTSSIDID